MSKLFSLKRNMSNADRLIRMLSGIAMLSSAHLIASVIGSILLYLIGLIFVSTSILAHCPLYTIIGFSSNGTEETGSGEPGN